MRNHQKQMQNAQVPVLSGDLGFEALRKSAAPYVKRHRMTVGRPAPLPCFAGQFGIRDIGDGQTVHQSRIARETEFETSFIAETGLLVSIVLDGRLTFSLDGHAYDFRTSGQPLAVAWANLKPVEVTRRTAQPDHLVKVQVHTPLSFFDLTWKAGIGQILGTHGKVISWSPGLAASEAAGGLIKGKDVSEPRSRMAASRFAVEALDSLLEHLEAQGDAASSRIAAARAYVEQTASEHPRLSDIAVATGFSVSSLQRIYRDTYGMTVIEHQRRLVLEQALRALRSGHISVAQAARIAGYRSPSNFSSAFAKEFGKPPSRIKSDA
ncbi:AraC family transcriptional regulator [uncultured Roseobacter sp.]|uniref:helix-turn-helix transcriptional regulator n=1 Tax=uncultured Roseobacter sp. TaxID=114847 RepID=UPI00261F8B16|nr:AraC family transcriptional regulator [uncultured Roseobacter sp.]